MWNGASETQMSISEWSFSHGPNLYWQEIWIFEQLFLFFMPTPCLSMFDFSSVSFALQSSSSFGPPHRRLRLHCLHLRLFRLGVDRHLGRIGALRVPMDQLTAKQNGLTSSTA